MFAGLAAAIGIRRSWAATRMHPHPRLRRIARSVRARRAIGVARTAILREHRSPAHTRSIVRSGAFPPAEQAFAYDRSVCQKAAPANGSVPLWRRAAKSFQQLALSVFEDPRHESNVDVSLPCPAVTVIPLSLLQHASRAEWVELLQNKAVVLGANLAGMPDFIDSTVHGQVPGAVWHAMALDNLVSLGDRYLAERHEVFKGVAEVVLILLLAYAFPYVLFGARASEGEDEPFLRELRAVADAGSRVPGAW